MFKNKKAESFAGIIVGVFILSFVILGIVNIITYSRDSVGGFEAENIVANLKMNYESIIKSLNIDFAGMSSGDEFYLEKNPSLLTYTFLSGAIHTDHQYVDSIGIHITDTSTYKGDIYIAKGVFYGNSTITADDGSTITVPLYKIITSTLNK